MGDMGDESAPLASSHRSVAIVYQIVHHFREAVFRAVTTSGEGRPRYEIWASPVNNLNSNATVDRADVCCCG